MMTASSYQLHIPMKTRVLNFFRMFIILTGFDQLLSIFTKNKPSTSLLVKMIPPNYLYQGGTSRKVTLNGIVFYTDISDSMDHVVYYGIKDAAQQQLFKLVHPGMRVMDIGTNIGLTALTFAKIVGDKGKVFAFEPDPINHSKARTNIDLNDFRSISLYKVGLGEEDGEASLYNVNSNNRGMLRILDGVEQSTEFEKTTIKLTTVDQFIGTVRSQVDLIKIDVEGYELKVLKGARNLLRDAKPVLFIELDDENLRAQGATALELVKYLHAFGYAVSHAVTGEIINEQTFFDHCHFDVIGKTKQQ